jgi:hypothetical protein
VRNLSFIVFLAPQILILGDVPFQEQEACVLDAALGFGNGGGFLGIKILVTDAAFRDLRCKLDHHRQLLLINRQQPDQPGEIVLDDCNLDRFPLTATLHPFRMTITQLPAPVVAADARALRRVILLFGVPLTLRTVQQACQRVGVRAAL